MSVNEVQEINGSELVTQKGVVHFYEIETEDIEHRRQNELKELVESVVNCLNTLKQKNSGTFSKGQETNTNNHFYKVYVLDSKVYVCTNDSEFTMPGYYLKECKNPHKSLMGMDDIYSEVHFERDHFILNGKFWRFINYYNMPAYVDFNEPSLYGDMFISFRKYPLEQAKAIASRSRRSHSANINGTTNRNIESEKSLDETESIYNSLIEGEENLFDMQAWYLIRGETKEELEAESSRLINIIKRKDGEPLLETVASQTIMRMFIPGDFVDFRRSHLATSSFLACFIPFTSEKVHSGGSEFYTTCYNKISIDLFDKKSALNFNALITGKSGSGKSVLAQKLILDSLAQNCSAVILDKGKSFEKISKYMNGNIFSEKFNPMQFMNSAFLKTFILSAIPESELTVRDRGRLHDLIKAYLLEKKQGTFKELISHLDLHFKDISCYFSEYWDFISDINIEIRNLTYVDTAIYPKSVVGSVIIYLIEYFKHIKGKKIFVFDECWEYLAKFSDYIEECFRTFRKDDGAAIAVTQDIRDFLMSASNVGQVVFNNTNHKFFFMQDTISEGHLCQEDSEIIKGLRTKHGKYSEFFYKDDYCRKVVRYPMSRLEHELFTTKKEHNIAFEKFHNHFTDYFEFREIMHKWVSFKYHHEVPGELT